MAYKLLSVNATKCLSRLLKIKMFDSAAIKHLDYVPEPLSHYYLFDMEIDLIFKIAAIGIIISILNQVLTRSGREEQATMTTLAGVIVVLMIIAQKISDLFNLVKTLFQF